MEAFRKWITGMCFVYTHAESTTDAGLLEVFSEPPDRPVLDELLDPRRAVSASAVLMEAAPTATTGTAATDLLSGIGSTSGRTSKESSPGHHSLEDALSLDDDSEKSSLESVPTSTAPPPEALARGFLLPRSPARLFVHNSVVESALSHLVPTSAADETLQADVSEHVTESSLPDSIKTVTEKDQTELREETQPETTEGSVLPQPEKDELDFKGPVLPEGTQQVLAPILPEDYKPDKSPESILSEKTEGPVKLIPEETTSPEILAEPTAVESVPEPADEGITTYHPTPLSKDHPLPEEAKCQHDSGVYETIRHHPTDETSAELISTEEYLTPETGGETSSASGGYHSPTQPLPAAGKSLLSRMQHSLFSCTCPATE